MPKSPLADGTMLAREAVGHAECRLVNGGKAKSALGFPTEAVPVQIEWQHALLCANTSFQGAQREFGSMRLQPCEDLSGIASVDETFSAVEDSSAAALYEACTRQTHQRSRSATRQQATSWLHPARPQCWRWPVQPSPLAQPRRASPYSVATARRHTNTWRPLATSSMRSMPEDLERSRCWVPQKSSKLNPCDCAIGFSAWEGRC